MTIEELEKIFNTCGYKPIKDDSVLLGLNLISKYLPNTTILCGADHDVIYSVNVEELIDAKCTEEDFKKLVDYGFTIQEEYFIAYV